jgi:hypothetical protein
MVMLTLCRTKPIINMHLDPSLLKVCDGSVGNLHPSLGNYRQCHKVIIKVNKEAMPLGTSNEGSIVSLIYIL